MRLPDYSLFPDPFIEALSANRMTKSKGWCTVHLASLPLRSLPFPQAGASQKLHLRDSGQWKCLSTREVPEQVSRALLKSSIRSRIWLPCSFLHIPMALALQSTAGSVLPKMAAWCPRG